MKKTFKTFALLSLLFTSSVIFAQDSLTFRVTTDLVSSYIWRGTVGSKDPSFQPTIAMDYGGLEVGIWGSTNYLGTYKEVDPYISYTKGLFKVVLTDYDWIFANKYFHYDNKTTDHIIELGVNFLGTEKLPLSVSVNTMLFGADKKYDFDSLKFTTDQNYSTYIELGYAFEKCNVFLGFTPMNGYYGSGYGVVDKPSICNLGISSTNTLKISKDLEIPVKASFIINPQAENVFLTFGFTL